MNMLNTRESLDVFFGHNKNDFFLVDIFVVNKENIDARTGFPYNIRQFA